MRPFKSIQHHHLTTTASLSDRDLGEYMTWAIGGDMCAVQYLICVADCIISIQGLRC